MNLMNLPISLKDEFTSFFISDEFINKFTNLLKSDKFTKIVLRYIVLIHSINT
jgi:hypothetical protein